MIAIKACVAFREQEYLQIYQWMRYLDKINCIGYARLEFGKFSNSSFFYAYI